MSIQEAKVKEKSVCTQYKRVFLFFIPVLYAGIGMMLKYRTMFLTYSYLKLSYSRYSLKIGGEDGWHGNRKQRDFAFSSVSVMHSSSQLLPPGDATFNFQVHQELRRKHKKKTADDGVKGNLKDRKGNPGKI